MTAMQRYYLTHKRQIKQYAKTWYRQNKDKIRLYHKTLKYRLCKKKSMNKWIQRKQDYVYKIKSNPCMDCGNKFNPWQMEFDHIKGKKVWCVGRMTYGSQKLLDREMAKCELVCANCHKDRTYKRLHKELA